MSTAAALPKPRPERKRVRAVVYEAPPDEEAEERVRALLEKKLG